MLVGCLKTSLHFFSFTGQPLLFHLSSSCGGGLRCRERKRAGEERRGEERRGEERREEGLKSLQKSEEYFTTSLSLSDSTFPSI